MATTEVDGGGDDDGDVRVTLLVRSNCPTCARMQTVVREVCERTGHGWQVVDVGAPDADPELRAEYADVVPVTLVDGREVANWSLPPAVLVDALGETA